MGTTFRAHGWIKHCEEDVYASGCTGQGRTWSGQQCFSAPTLQALLTSIKEFAGGDPDANDDTQLDACDEYGRVDIQVHEDENGTTAHNFDAWKAGEARLWLCTYTFHVEACSPVMFGKPKTTDVRTQTTDWTQEQLNIGRPLNTVDQAKVDQKFQRALNPGPVIDLRPDTVMDSVDPSWADDGGK